MHSLQYPNIEILAGHQKRFLAGYPWVYTNEIEQSNSTKYIEFGHLVNVRYLGKPLGVGYYNRQSLIAFRVLTRRPEEMIDANFFSQKLRIAEKLRNRFYKDPYYRLIHAEGDELPGLIIDRFKDVFVVQINTLGMERLREPLIDALKLVFNPTTIYFKNDMKARVIEGLPITEPFIVGEDVTEISVIENGIEYRIDISQGQKTGWFYDHRENRQLLATLAKDKSIIDYFCYGGGFSIQAAKQGAKHVIGVDRANAAIENAKRSAKLNQVETRCEFICNEVFPDMETRINARQTFDIVILDPPAFVKVKKDIPVGLKGYEKLISQGIQLVAPQGLLFIASCSYHVKEFDLKTCLTRALHKNGRTGKVLHRTEAGFDHPHPPLLDESDYLKGFIVYIE
jgi:23S rRNA (cytosine1962-C5)-methyltransferase